MKFVFVSSGIIKEDGEFNSSGMIQPLIGGRQFPSEMVKCGSDMVNDLASKNAPSWIDFPVNEIFQFIKGSLIQVGENGLFALEPDDREGGEERFDFRIQYADVLIGPF